MPSLEKLSASPEGTIDADNSPKEPKKRASKPTVPEAPPISNEVEKPKGRGPTRPYPQVSFEEAMVLAAAIQQHAGSNPIRRVTLFDLLDRAPDSGASRQLITNAGRYGLIRGGYQAEQIQLTPDGDVATNSDLSTRERTRARIKLSIDSVEAFKGLYSKFAGQKLPSAAMLEDAVIDLGIPPNLKNEAVEIFVVNLRFVGLLQTLSGAERILTVDHALDQLPAAPLGVTHRPLEAKTDQPITLHSDAQFDRTCFFIGPIGEPESESRKHSDLILESLIRPAMEEFGFEVKRADEIQNAGLISKQVFEMLLKCRLAIADLSYHNPNVFYEMAIRHARNLPVIQIIPQG